MKIFPLEGIHERWGPMEQLRREHAILDDTHVVITETNKSPMYIANGNKGASVHVQVGIRWIEKHYPEMFEEMMKCRLSRPHKS